MLAHIAMQCAANIGLGNPAGGAGAGVRSLLYGSAAGMAGCVLLVAVGARALDVSAPQELRERLTGAAGPLAGRLQAALLPVKARIQVRSGAEVWAAVRRA